MYGMDGYTRKFDVINNADDTRTILSAVYEALRVKGYNPINQIDRKSVV